MLIEILLFILTYILFLASTALIPYYDESNEKLKSYVDSQLFETNLSSTKRAEMSLLYLKHNKLLFQKAHKIFIALSYLLGLLTAIWFIASPELSMIENIITIILFTIINAGVAAFVYLIAEDCFSYTEHKFTIKPEAILNFYLKKEYPKLSSILMPVYKHASIDSYRRKLEVPNKKYTFSLDVMSRFGLCLIRFINTFEKAMLGENSKVAFNSTVLKAENIDVLSKLIVMLEEPLLINQLIYEEENETALLFNNNLEKMVNELEKEINTITKSEITTAKLETSISKENQEKQARETLDLLVKQNFNLIK